MDPYYHLLITRQVADAGGLLAYEAWEYAPVGRPHLYPPALHLLLAAVLKLTGSPLVTMRLASALLLPALLLSLLIVMRRLLAHPTALACLLCAMVPLSFHLHASSRLAATLGLLELLWLVDALAHRRPLAAGLLIALMCYTHLGLPWIALAMMGIAAALRAVHWQELARASWGFALALPWWWHVVSHRSILRPFPRLENTMIELMPLLCVVAVIGAWRCWRLKGPWRWLIAGGLSFMLLAPHYTFRWLSGEGMLAIVLLAGVGMDWAAQQLVRVFGLRLRPAAMNMLLFVLLTVSPALIQTPTGWRWAWGSGSPLHLVGVPSAAWRQLEVGLYSPPIERVVRTVAAQSQPGEILWSNASYALGFIAALAHRPMSSAMRTEVVPVHAFDPIRATHLIVWFKTQPVPGMPPLALLESQYPLTRIAEDDVAIVFRQAGERERAQAPRGVLPLATAWALLGLVMGGIIWDLSRHTPGMPV